MAITIKFDKESEFQWIKCVMDSGVLNCTENMRFLNKEFGVNPTQTVEYIRSEEYINDIKDAIDAFDKKLTDQQKTEN